MLDTFDKLKSEIAKTLVKNPNYCRELGMSHSTILDLDLAIGALLHELIQRSNERKEKARAGSYD